MQNHETDNYRTYVVASEQEEGPWSLAYVSQVYGTIFGVYSNLEIEQKGSQFFCNKIHLKLGNFKGLMMLGISDVKARQAEDPNTGEPTIVLDVYIQGLANKRSHTVDLQAQKINICEGSKIVVQRHLVPLHTDQAEEHGLFDTEFYYRDSPNANVVNFAQHAEAFHAYKSGQASEIREAMLNEIWIACINASRYVKIET